MASVALFLAIASNLEPDPSVISVSSWPQLTSLIANQTSDATYLLESGFVIGGSFQHIELVNGFTVVLLGEGGDLVLDAGHKDRFFNVFAGQLVVSGVVFKDGLVGSGRRLGETMHASRNNPDFIINFSGGAIFVGDGRATIKNCTFIGNSAGGYGGAVVVQTTADFTDCRFEENTAEDGGAIAAGTGIDSGPSGGLVNITDCAFEKPADSSAGNNDLWRMMDASTPGDVTFFCPEGTAGASVAMSSTELAAADLPPNKNVVHCA
jgi:predicted outer membrane repeat protein